MTGSSRHAARWLVIAGIALGAVGRADVLPDDRADLLVHKYEGGGITVQGPSVLVRKKFGDSVSVSYQYYEDLISSASIDVITQASKYKERRTQHNVGLDFLHNNTLYSVGYINSDEPDYKSKTAFASVSQSMFGDLTTISFGFSRGWDIVGRAHQGIVDETFHQDVDHRNWSVGLSQVLTRNLLLGVNVETDENEGYLHSPYRSIRYVDPTVERGYSYEPERYPATRTTNAASFTLKYYLPFHAALSGTYRYFEDTWNIRAHTGTLELTQPVGTSWTFDATGRFYTQTHASFYSDLFPYENAQNFMARDRELAQFTSLTVGFGASYEFHPSLNWTRWIEKGTLNASLTHIRINYADFRDVLDTGYVAGDEPLYVLTANVFQGFISIWY